MRACIACIHLATLAKGSLWYNSIYFIIKTGKALSFLILNNEKKILTVTAILKPTLSS